MGEVGELGADVGADVRADVVIMATGFETSFWEWLCEGGGAEEAHALFKIGFAHGGALLPLRQTLDGTDDIYLCIEYTCIYKHMYIYTHIHVHTGKSDGRRA